MARPPRKWGPAAGLVTGFALISAAVVALVAGCSTSPSATATPAGTIPATAAAAATPSATPPATRSSSASPATSATSATSPAVPSRLVIPALGVNAPVVRIQVDDATGALDIPTDVAQVGWWDEGPAPGSSFGTVVLTGHIDSASQGLGALARLRSLNPGSTLTLTTSHGRMRYLVKARREYDKANLPVDVFSSVGASRLVLVSCGGPFNTKTHHYRDNIVIYAVPTT